MNVVFVIMILQMTVSRIVQMFGVVIQQKISVVFVIIMMLMIIVLVQIVQVLLMVVQQ